MMRRNASDGVSEISFASRRPRIVLGVCAMAKKTTSKPMQEILRRLPSAVFQIEIFNEASILQDPIEAWPLCDCLIAFHSSGFPLEKAQAYAALRRPFMVNDLRRQFILRDRRRVYDTLAQCGVPTPRHAAMSRDLGGQTLEEFDDYIIVNGVRLEKPFVEKPVDADDHNLRIYYPMSAGGGSKRLFRKIDNKSSQYYADEHKVRRDGSYLYEEFVDTQGTDVKVYAVGPYYGHAEARKSPALDGIVLRAEDGKELRYPVILSWIEKDIAFKIYHAFKQTVCGFDILRAHDGKTMVCDVNGWSFVKKSRKYYDDCASLLAELMVHRRAPQPLTLGRPTSSASLAREDAEPALRRNRHRELRCVIAVVRHGDRTPKRKLKVRLRHPKLVAVHTAHAKKSEKKAAAKNEAKIRESRDLRAILMIVREVLEDDEDLDIPRTALAQLRDVLEQHIPALPKGDQVSSLNTALFSGCKLQLKPTDWIGDKVTEIVLVLKWGGVLTELGVEHACALGAHFRRSMYPASDDGAGLLRLHATFRHDLKIRTSDEGRVMKTGAAFTKGLLELEGDISPILVSLIHRGRSDVHMLDRAGNHEAQELLTQAKLHVERAFQVDVQLRGDESDDEDVDRPASVLASTAAQARLQIAPDGPASVLSALRQLENPRRALDRLYDLVDGLVVAVEARADKLPDVLYMGETRRVWLDSWRDVKRELRCDDSEVRYDLSKIPEIFDKVRFDAQHNLAKLDLENVFPYFPELVHHAQLLSQAVAPLEFGGANNERRDVAWLVSRALLDKIRLDLHTARGASGDANAGLHFQLDDDPQHLADAQIKSSWRAVRSRLYFTSESHLYSLLAALRLPAIRRDTDLHRPSILDAPAKHWLSHIPELSYLSHIVFRLWEDTTVEDDDDPLRYMVECSFSPGTNFDYHQLNGSEPRSPPFPNTNINPPGLPARRSPSESTLASDPDQLPPTLPLEPFASVSRAIPLMSLAQLHSVQATRGLLRGHARLCHLRGVRRHCHCKVRAHRKVADFHSQVRRARARP